ARFRRVGPDTPLAEILLSAGLGVASADPRTYQYLARPAEFSRGSPARRLAIGDLALAGRGDLRFFLGNVELFFLPKMDLSYARRRVSPRFRDAPSRLSRL